jgi:hypothetical protein
MRPYYLLEAETNTGGRKPETGGGKPEIKCLNRAMGGSPFFEGGWGVFTFRGFTIT